MYIYLFGLNHKTAPVEVREKIALSKPQIRAKAGVIKELSQVKGLIVLSTCNRTEFYLSTADLPTGREALLGFIAGYSGLSRETLNEYAYEKEDRQAAGHLFRVAAGLDSMILGESQILGQVVEAYEIAWELGLSNSPLNGLFQKAASAGKRVRTETHIDRQAVSVGSVAVELAQQVLGELAGQTVLVLGAGDTSELVVKHLVAHGVATVVVANRTFDRATKLAEVFGGRAIRLDQLSEHLAEADIVISCTAAPTFIVKPESIRTLLPGRGQKPLLFIDIAVPRDVHPQVALLPGVTVYDIDDLQQVLRRNLAKRKKEAVKAELLVTEELNGFYQWFDTLTVVPVIRALKEKGEYIKKRELEWALAKLGNLTEKEHKVIVSLANSLVNKIFNDPIVNLKQVAQSEMGPVYCDALRQLFNLDKEEVDSKLDSAKGSTIR